MNKQPSPMLTAQAQAMLNSALASGAKPASGVDVLSPDLCQVLEKIKNITARVSGTDTAYTVIANRIYGCIPPACSQNFDASDDMLSQIQTAIAYLDAAVEAASETQCRFNRLV